jgi:hypothetical protein
MSETAKCDRCGKPLEIGGYVARRLTLGRDVATVCPHCRSLPELIEEHDQRAEGARVAAEECEQIAANRFLRWEHVPEYLRLRDSWLITARHHEAEAERLREREAALHDYEPPVSEEESP